MDSQPWKNEPDFARWIDQATGLRCVIRRNGAGSLCGYVRVPQSKLLKKLVRYKRLPAYKLFEKVYRKSGYSHPLISGLEVHGGITFTGKSYDYRMDGFWIGFDCSHSFDYMPLIPNVEGGTYRTFDYVKGEVTDLAAQLKCVLEATK